MQDQRDRPKLTGLAVAETCSVGVAAMETQSLRRSLVQKRSRWYAIEA